MLLDLFINLVLLLMSLVHLNILCFMGHFLILTLLIRCFRLIYLLSSPSVLVMLENCLLIELNMVGCTKNPSLLQDAASGCS